MAELSKTVLAIDTALGGVSVGIMASNGHIVSRMIETAREQAVKIQSLASGVKNS